MGKQTRKNHGGYRLEPTAAVVMVWARGLYSKGLANRYLKMLDLSSAKGMIRECDKICDWYGEVILNRKYLIRHLAEQKLKAAKEPHQVIILASGKTPLALELLSRCGSKLKRVIEVDTCGLQAKKRIFRRIAPEICKKIRFISADVTSKKVADAFNARADMPAVIIIEGLSYYIPTRKLRAIIRMFCSKGQRNLLILEYLVPYTSVAKTRRYIPRENFSVPRRAGHLRSLTHYTKTKLGKILKQLGGKHTRCYNLKDMELLRTSKNRYFKHHNEGWLECITARI